jgi:hypothetical protein
MDREPGGFGTSKIDVRAGTSFEAEQFNRWPLAMLTWIKPNGTDGRSSGPIGARGFLVKGTRHG